MTKKDLLNEHKLKFGQILLILLSVSALLIILHYTFYAYNNPWIVLHSHNYRSIIAILTTNFFHHDIDHLVGNLISFWIIGFFALFTSGKHALKGMFFGAIGCGVTAWTFAPGGTIVIGFSGVIFSLIGILFISSIQSRQPIYILLICFGLFVMGSGFFDTIRPTALTYQNNLSWQAHLGGFIGGIWYLINSKSVSLTMLLKNNIITAEEYLIIIDRGQVPESSRRKK